MHLIDRYKWDNLGLCEMRWKQSGEITTDNGHIVYNSERKDKHEQCLGVLVHKGIVKKLSLGVALFLADS